MSEHSAIAQILRGIWDRPKGGIWNRLKEISHTLRGHKSTQTSKIATVSLYCESVGGYGERTDPTTCCIRA